MIIVNCTQGSSEWLQARDQHINHIMACLSCYAPAGRHCATGANLRQKYDQTPMGPPP